MKIIEDFQSAKKALSRSLSKGMDSDKNEHLVRQIVSDVHDQGDTALFDYTERFDNVRLSKLEVHKKEIEQALGGVDTGLLSAMKLAAERITAYHTDQKKSLLYDNTDKNLGWLIRPLERVGIHIPGFTAPLPSSLLMTAIPARIAGVKDIIMVTPPGHQGRVSPVTLAAAAISRVDRVFSIGGAQAIAALAYGTETIPRVDKVCGPGNIYSNLAKKIVYGDVGVDGLYGPSEVIIIADSTANPGYCAADLIAQAEHGSGASAIMITTSRTLADAVNREIENQIHTLQRKDIISGSLDNRGMIVIVANVEEAIDLANLYAPEHLCLVFDNADKYIGQVLNAGCLFVGENSLEALVDYVAGPSHVLPTGGTARFGSGLSILDFIKLIGLVNTNETDITELGEAAYILARAEGLDAHARAVEKRLEELRK